MVKITETEPTPGVMKVRLNKVMKDWFKDEGINRRNVVRLPLVQ